MTVADSHATILAALDKKIVREAIDACAIAGRLDQYVSHAISVAPQVSAWASGRLALLRQS